MNVEELFSLKGKTALITGASSGLGAHFAQLLARAGARVVLAARRLDRLEALAEHLAHHEADTWAQELDVTSADSVERALTCIHTEVGPLDILVNNAGVAAPAPLLELEEDAWQRVLETNLTGCWRVAHHVSTQMVEDGVHGSIVNIASIVGMRTAGHLTAYATSKAGLLHMTRQLALELAPHSIRVNALAPGYVRTPMNDDFLDSPAGERMRSRIPTRRFGEATDLDGPMLLLCSDASRHMTGSVLTVDGGHSIQSL